MHPLNPKARQKWILKSQQIHGGQYGNKTNQHRFTVNDIVETIPDNEFDEFRHHRGATSYHPKMMLKVILYAYTQSVFSGRKIEKCLMIASE